MRLLFWNVVSLTLLVGSALPASAVPVSAVSLAGGMNSPTGIPVSAGFSFTTGPAPVTIDALAVVSPDIAGTNVRLYDGLGTIYATINILQSDPSDGPPAPGTFNFHQIATVTLPAATTFYVAADLLPGQLSNYLVAGLTTDSAITFAGEVESGGLGGTPTSDLQGGVNNPGYFGPSFEIVRCGDGIVQLSETCDDGNTTSFDGCSSTCQVEPGWSCSGAPSVCTHTGPQIDFNNTATRQVAILNEDTPCVNTAPGSSVSADPGCFVFANDLHAIYTDPTNDYYGTLSFIPGPSAATGGSNTWQIEVSKAVWAKGLGTTFHFPGLAFTNNSALDVQFDIGNGAVVALNADGSYWSGAAGYGNIPLMMTGYFDPADYPFYGTFSLETFQGPIVISCGWDNGAYPLPIPQPPSELGPGAPGSPPCEAAIPQPGFALVPGPVKNSGMTFFTYTTVLDVNTSMPLVDSPWTAFKWSLQETVDTDGDGVPDQFDNCPYTPNGPALGSCINLSGTTGSETTCTTNAQCAANQYCSLNQEDTGGIGTGSPPDGIGDACQCGDVNNDGIVNNNDATLIKRAVAGIFPYLGGVTTLPGYNKCQVVNGAPGQTCSNTQASIIQRAVAGLAPGILQGCHAATTYP